MLCLTRFCVVLTHLCVRENLTHFVLDATQNCVRFNTILGSSNTICAYGSTNLCSGNLRISSWKSDWFTSCFLSWKKSLKWNQVRHQLIFLTFNYDNLDKRSELAIEVFPSIVHSKSTGRNINAMNYIFRKIEVIKLCIMIRGRNGSRLKVSPLRPLTAVYASWS